MRHQFRLAGLVLFLILGSASAQQAANSPPQPQSTARRSFDPMAHAKAGEAPKGIVETTLAGINPHDKDYGQVIADWRKEVFENTLDRVYFWGLLVLGVGLGMSLVGNGWLVRDREKRLGISADVVTQLYNAYIGSRAKAIEVVAKYNRLVDRYNSLEIERQRLADQVMRHSERAEQPELDFNQARADRGAASINGNITASSTPEIIQEQQADLAKIETLTAKLAEVETTLQRKTAQLQAKDNQITNLRERLSRAHDNLEGQRKSGTQTA
jgi:hypothetical protein